MDHVDQASNAGTHEDVNQLNSSPVILRRSPMEDSAPSLEPPLRDSTSHLSSGNLGSPTKQRPCSVIASKNTRKRMEDRHVVLHDLKAYLPSALQSKVDPEEHVSYYAVFDGHAGTDAACYAASNLHELLVASSHYPSDPVQAFNDAFLTCDKDFTTSSKKSGSTAVCALFKGDYIYLAWLGDSIATLVRDGVTVKIMDSHKPNRDDERARVESLGGTVILWGTWRVNGQLAVSRAIGDGEYKPFVSAQPDITTIARNGTEDFVIVACDGLWDTVTPEEATEVVMTYLKENQTRDGDLENLSAKLASVAKEKGSSDNITIIVILLKPVQELILPPLVPDQCDGRDSPHTHGITSTSDYVFRDSSGSGRTSTEPTPTQADSLPSPTIRFDTSLQNGVDGEVGGVFSPANAFSLGNGFDLSGEQFNTNLEDIRFSNGSTGERISGVELLNGPGEPSEEEMLKKQSIDKVDDLLKMLDREGGDSPSPEDEVDGGLSLDEVLARAREQGDTGDFDQADGGEAEDSGDSSEEEDIVTEFKNTNGGNTNISETSNIEDNKLRQYEEGRRQPCEQVVVVATGPEECGMVVPPSQELPSQQVPEVMSVMSCSMVVEERNGGEEDLKHEDCTVKVVEEGGGELETTSGFMLKTPGEEDIQLSSFEPEVEKTNTGSEEKKEEVKILTETAPVITVEDIPKTSMEATESNQESVPEPVPKPVIEVSEVVPLSESNTDGEVNVAAVAGYAGPDVQVTPATPPRLNPSETEAPMNETVQVQINEDIETTTNSNETSDATVEDQSKTAVTSAGVEASEKKEKVILTESKTAKTTGKPGKPTSANPKSTTSSTKSVPKSPGGAAKPAGGLTKTGAGVPKTTAAPRVASRPIGGASSAGAGSSTGARPKAPMASSRTAAPSSRKTPSSPAVSKPGESSDKPTVSKTMSKPAPKVTSTARTKPTSVGAEGTSKNVTANQRGGLAARPTSSAQSGTDSTASSSSSIRKLSSTKPSKAPTTTSASSRVGSAKLTSTSVSRPSSTVSRPTSTATKPRSSTLPSSTTAKTRTTVTTSTAGATRAVTTTSSRPSTTRLATTATDRADAQSKSPTKPGAAASTKPSAAASRVAAARAAAKAAKPTKALGASGTKKPPGSANKKTEEYKEVEVPDEAAAVPVDNVVSNEVASSTNEEVSAPSKDEGVSSAEVFDGSVPEVHQSVSSNNDLSSTEVVSENNANQSEC